MSDRAIKDVKEDLVNAKDDASRAMSKEFDKLKDAFADLRKDFKRMASHPDDQERSGIVGLKDKAVDAVDSAKESVDHLRTSFVDTLEEIEDKITKNPLTSVAVAVGVGYLYAKLFCRR